MQSKFMHNATPSIFNVSFTYLVFEILNCAREIYILGLVMFSMMSSCHVVSFAFVLVFKHWIIWGVYHAELLMSGWTLHQWAWLWWHQVRGATFPMVDWRTSSAVILQPLTATLTMTNGPGLLLTWASGSCPQPTLSGMHGDMADLL